MNKGFKDRLRICVIYLCFFAFNTGGSAARFSKTFFGPFRSLKFLLLKIGSSMNKGFKDRLRVFVFVFAFTSKQGEMLPVFQKKRLLRSIWSLKCFLSKHLGPSDVFRGFPWTRASRTGSEFVLFVFVFALKQGEMLPVFQKHFLGPFDLWNFYFENWVLHEQGLQGQGQSSFFVFVFTSKQGKCCPFFKKDCWVHSIFEMFPLKTWVHPMFSESFHEQGLQGQAQNLCYLSLFFAFKTGGNAARFSKSIFGPFRSLKFLLWKLGPLQEQAQSFCFCLCLYLKTGGNAARFSKKDFWGPFGLWNLSFKKLGSNRCFPKLSMNKGFKGQAQNFVLFIFVFCFRTGGNAVRFSNTFFGHFWSLKFLLWKLGPSDVFRIFPCTRASRTGSRWLRVFIFVFAFTSKQGKCCPFCKKKIWGPITPEILERLTKIEWTQTFLKRAQHCPCFHREWEILTGVTPRKNWTGQHFPCFTQKSETDWMTSK